MIRIVSCDWSGSSVSSIVSTVEIEPIEIVDNSLYGTDVSIRELLSTILAKVCRKKETSIKRYLRFLISNSFDRKFVRSRRCRIKFLGNFWESAACNESITTTGKSHSGMLGLFFKAPMIRDSSALRLMISALMDFSHSSSFEISFEVISSLKNFYLLKNDI